MTSSFQLEVEVPGGWDSWGPEEGTESSESRILGASVNRWTAELKEPGLRLGQGRRLRPLVGEQEDTMGRRWKREEVGGGGGAAHQSLRSTL